MAKFFLQNWQQQKKHKSQYCTCFGNLGWEDTKRIISFCVALTKVAKARGYGVIALQYSRCFLPKNFDNVNETLLYDLNYPAWLISNSKFEKKLNFFKCRWRAKCYFISYFVLSFHFYLKIAFFWKITISKSRNIFSEYIEIYCRTFKCRFWGFLLYNEFFTAL